MASDRHAIRRSLASRVKQTLSGFGLENAVVGGKYEDLRQAISDQTGDWGDASYYSKPSRLIVHLDDQGGEWKASTPAVKGNVAYANTAGHRSVGCIFVRVVPVVKIVAMFEPHPEWEWILWYCFWPKLKSGSSGEVFSGFDPVEGTFTYKGERQSYIAAGLVTLNDPDESMVVGAGSRRLRYWRATEAIRELINVSPASPASVRQEVPANENA